MTIPHRALRHLLACLAFLITCAATSFADPITSQSLITDANLRALQSANTYGAQLFHMQPPGPDFIAQMRRAIPRDFANMDAGIRQAMATIQTNLPSLKGYFERTDSQRLASFVKTWQPKIMSSSDPIEQQVRLAEIMAFSAFQAHRTGNGATPSNATQQQQIESLKYKQLQRGIRSYSPTCAPGSTDPSCHP